MNPGHRRPSTSIFAALTAVSLCALSLLAGPVSARPGGTTRTATAAAVRPMIKLVSATHRVSIQRYSHRVYLDLGTYLVAGDQPFEIRATRSSYSQPIVASQVLPGGDVQLPPGLLRDFSGFPGFFRISLRDHSGALVLDRHQSFCPNGDSARIRPGASGTSAYPFDCPIGPFTLGSVWGIQAGWGVSTMNWNARARQAEARHVHRDRRDRTGLSQPVRHRRDRCAGDGEPPGRQGRQRVRSGVSAPSVGARRFGLVPATRQRADRAGHGPGGRAASRPAGAPGVRDRDRARQLLWPSPRLSGTPGPHRWWSTASAGRART